MWNAFDSEARAARWAALVVALGYDTITYGPGDVAVPAGAPRDMWIVEVR